MEQSTIDVLWLFSHHQRLRMMGVMKHGEFTVKELAARLPIKVPSVMSHLTSFRNAGVLDSSSGSRPVYYKLNHKKLGEALADFCADVGLSIPRRSAAATAKKAAKKKATKKAKRKANPGKKAPKKAGVRRLRR